MTKKPNVSNPNSSRRIIEIHRAANIEVDQLFSSQPSFNLSDPCLDIEFKEYNQSTQVALPQPLSLPSRYDQLLAKRHTARQYGPDKISLNELSTLLYLSAGISTTKPICMSSGDWNFTRRSYPSAGARYPIEVYVISLRVHGVERGLYHYNVRSHSMELLDRSNFLDELRAITGENWIANAQCAIALTAVFHRTINKYGDRGYRYILMEAGHLMQIVCTASQALKINVCPVGGFVDDRLTSLLGVSISDEIPVYLAILGKP